ncbi:MAG: 2-oxoacid:acceptor oxidoreductase family protein, partial [Candidatus Bathyarchaeota archaeon]
IRFPRVIQPNVRVCLTQKAYNKYRDLIRPGGLLLTDKHYVKQEKKVDARQVELDMYVETKERIGKPVVFNVCMLGSLIELTRLVKKTSILKVLKDRMPSELLSENNEALKLGIELAVKYKQTNRFNFYFY